MTASFSEEHRRVLQDAAEAGRRVKVRVSGCNYACCGRGWTRRDYEQTHTGDVSAAHLGLGGLLLSVRGVGTVSYLVEVLPGELLEVEQV